MRELLLAGRRRIRTVLISRDLSRARNVEEIVGLARELKVRVKPISSSEFDAAARTSAPQGVIAYADPLPLHDLVELAAGPPPPFLLAVDGITDPGNLGAVLRTAECAGVTGVVLRSHRAARITPTAAKAAAGAIEHLRFAVVPGVPAALKSLNHRGVWTVGLDPAGNRPLHKVDLAGEAVALVLGAEGQGLSRLTAQRCDVLASIPMRGAIGSLNVAAAAAVACFDVARRR